LKYKKGVINMTEKDEIEIVEELDTTGLFCPEPLFEVREMSETLEIGQCFKVIADDPAAEEDLHRWAKRTETEVLDFKKDDDLLTFIFRKKR
jgi:TusA-related sulfurtransferase